MSERLVFLRGREPHRIPREYLIGTKSKMGAELPDAPLVVFINSRSGGRAGARLTQVLCHVIGHVQASAPSLRSLRSQPFRIASPKACGGQTNMAFTNK